MENLYGTYSAGGCFTEEKKKKNTPLNQNKTSERLRRSGVFSEERRLEHVWRLNSQQDMRKDCLI